MDRFERTAVTLLWIAAGCLVGALVYIWTHL